MRKSCWLGLSPNGKNRLGSIAEGAPQKQIFYLRIICEKLTHISRLFAVDLDKIVGKRAHAFDRRCYRMIVTVSYKDQIANMDVRRKIQAAIWQHDELLNLVKKRKQSWFGHISRSFGLAKSVLQGVVKRRKKDKEDRKMGGIILLQTALGWTLTAKLGQLKTGPGV